MAPGPTFERVYRALRDQLKSGCFAPGQRLEPAALSADLNASVTPIRDALHRLAGERLVETPRQDGFRAPLLTELALRDLYRWNADLLLLALRSAAGSHAANRRTVEADEALAPLAPPGIDLASATERLFLQIGWRSGNPEHVHAIANASDRLHGLRRIEPELFDDAESEFARLARLVRESDTPALRRAIARYHRRRHRAAPHVLELLHRPRAAGGAPDA